VADPGSEESVLALVAALVKLPHETEWVEFKENNEDPEEVGEYVSALANGAVLRDHSRAYLVWGIRDLDHAVVGTAFDPFGKKVGNEDFLNWLTRLLTPQLHVQFHLAEDADGRRLVVLEIDAGAARPVAFKGNEFIRVGSYKKRLKDHPGHERELWRRFESRTFESNLATGPVNEQDVVRLIDYPAYFQLLHLPLPDGATRITQALAADGLVCSTDNGNWAITNLGAVLFARDLEDFPSVSRKAARLIQYKGNSRIETVREQIGTRGYAAGFSGLMSFLSGLLPENEIIVQALRRNDPLYPDLVIRELVANALIHQDFTLTGTGPTIELFEDRLEITNPGTPLVEPERFVDSPPQSRNEALAAMLRRMGICEERGSGWDKVLFEIEYHQLPPPLAEVTDQHTRITLFGPRPLTKMDKADRIRALYQHAALKYVMRENVTNTTVRQRFGLPDKDVAVASRLIREAVDAGAIGPYDPEAGPRAMRYLPWWALPTNGA
jgi:ATP-dependent DNA helicase RecG